MNRLNRRQFLVGIVGGSFVASIPLTGTANLRAGAAVQAQDQALPEAFSGNLGFFVRIDPNNQITIGSPTTDMGQGVFTSMPMILAEEMDADWALVKVEAMPLALRKVGEKDVVSDISEKGTDYAHAYQGSGGSQSTSKNFAYLRQAGADIRDRFLRAASDKLQLPLEKLDTHKSHVLVSGTAKRIPYSDLLHEAAKLEATAPEKLKLKSANQFHLIGKSSPQKEALSIVTGKPIYGIDQEMPGMLHAVLARCPYFKGNVKSFDDKAARAVPGVIEVLKIKRSWAREDREADSLFALHGAVAVVAKSLWAALKARNALVIEWDKGEFTHEDTAFQEAEMRRVLQEDGKPLMEVTKGDVEASLAKAAKVVEGEYFAKPLAHANIEPMNALADMRGDRPYVIASHQYPDLIARAVAEHCGYDPLLVRVDSARIGCGFGRKANNDFVSEAIYLSHLLKKPVKVTWTRDDDFACDAYNPASLHRFRAGLDANNKLIAWDHQRSSPGFGFHPEDFPNNLVDHFRTRAYRPKSGMWYGAWRGPGHNTGGFAIESFMDELAHATGLDPLEFLLRVLGEARKFPYKGYGAEFLDSGRMSTVLKLAAEKADWGKPLPKGQGRGIAGHFTFGSYCAHVVEVSVEKGKLQVLRVVSAIDCGQPVNRLGIQKQIEGGAIDALSTALRLEVNLKGGTTLERNYDSYPNLRIAEAPLKMETHIVESSAYPSGTGETSLPPFIPALCNAIYAATGKRIRRLPIGDQLA